MRLPTGHRQRLGQLGTGVILEGDGELEFPPSVQPVCNLHGVVERYVLGTTGTVDSHVFISHSLTIAGAGGATNVNLCGFPRGAWHFNLFASVQFTGAAAPANFSGVSFAPSAQPGVLVPIYRQSHFSDQDTETMSFDIAFGSTTDLVLQRGTTVAGDNLAVHCTAYAQRIY